MTTKPDQAPEWTWGPWAPVAGGLAAASLALAEPYAGYPGWFPLGVAAAGATGSMLTALRKSPLGLASYRAGVFLAAGSWATWTTTQGWSWLGGAALAGGVLVAGLLGPHFAPPPATPEQTAETRAPARSDVKAAIDRFLRVEAPGVRILEKRLWETGNGYSVTVEFPADSGLGVDELAGIVLQIGNRLRLPAGCVPNAEEGPTQGTAILNVPTVDDLSKEAVYPRDYSPLTINEEQAIGIFGDGSWVYDEMRQASKFIAGRKGGGKTNTMDVYGANLARSEDALIWHVDLNGGGMSVPWMLPYLLEALEEPVVNWVAHDPMEALLMSEVLLAIVKSRKAQFGKAAAQANSRLVPISAQRAGIYALIDEGAEVLGETAPYSKLRENFSEIQRLGRAVGVHLIVSTLRPTGDHVPVQVRKNCSTGIATKVKDDAELGYMFDYEKGIRARHLKTAGEAFFRREDPDAPSNDVRKVKVWHLLPAQIAEIARATAGLRPELDRLGQEVADSRMWVLGEPVSAIYSNRWRRLGPWLDALRAGEDVTERFGQRTDDAPQTPEPGQAPAPKTQATALAEYQAAKQRARDEEIKARILDADEATVEQLFSGIVGETAPRPEAPGPITMRIRAEMIGGIVREAGPEGIRRQAIINRIKEAGIDVTDQTVSDWIAAARELGLIRPGAKQGLWLPAEEETPA